MQFESNIHKKITFIQPIKLIHKKITAFRNISFIMDYSLVLAYGPTLTGRAGPDRKRLGRNYPARAEF